MNILPIRTKTDHKKAVARITQLMELDPARGTPDSDELEVLAQLVEIYEKKHHSLGAPSPIELVLFAMEQRGMTQKDMKVFFGSPSRVSEVLSGKRPMTLRMIRTLHLGLKLPLDTLVMGSAQTRPAQAPRLQKPSSKAGKSRRLSPSQSPSLRPKTLLSKAKTACL